MEKAKIAPFVSLSDFVGVELAITPANAGWTRRPGGTADREFFVGDFEVEAALFHIHFDDVAVFYEGERPANCRFRCDMEDTGMPGAPIGPAFCRTMM